MTESSTTDQALPTVITTGNAVLRLRQQRLSASTRPYRARGCRAIRCQGCLLTERFCLCDTIKPQPASSRFCLIMFDTEPLSLMWCFRKNMPPLTGRYSINYL